MGNWQTGDVVQVDPEYDDVFGACFMVVTEPKSWGAQGYVTIPGKGPAYLRLNFKNGVKIGRCIWICKDEEE